MAVPLQDISRSVSATTAVWPGDRPVEWGWTLRQSDGDSVNVGRLCMSTHTGTHADAPYHADESGGRTETLPLPAFVGPARVVDVGDADAIRPRHLPKKGADRLLFKTPASALSDEEWPSSVVPLSTDAVRHLRKQGVSLVGTDAPSVDPLDSTSLPAHHALSQAGIVHLEGLRLRAVSPGRYTLLALPLKLPEADATPVRAVLAEGTLDPFENTSD